MSQRVAAVIATLTTIKGGHTKYKHFQRLYYSCLYVYTRNQYLWLNSSATTIVYYIKSLALFIPMHDFWPPQYTKVSSMKIAILLFCIRFFVVTGFLGRYKIY